MSIRVLYDTDFLIALFLSDQSTHKKAKQVFNIIQDKEPVILNLVKYELATVLSHKFSQKLSAEVMEKLNALPIHHIFFNNADEKAVWAEFYSHQKKKISFTDCANLVVAKKLNLKIASFDSFYPKELLAYHS